MTIRELNSECNISYGSCQIILTEDLRMRWVCIKIIVLRLKNSSTWILLKFERTITQNDSEFIENVITSDETWFFSYDEEPN